MPDKFVSKILTPFGERLLKASALTDELKEDIKDVVYINKQAPDFKFSNISGLISSGKRVVITWSGLDGSSYYDVSVKSSSSIMFVCVKNGEYRVLTLNSDDTSSAETHSISDIEFINFSTTFAQVSTILSDGKLPILVEETTPSSPNYYYLINNNAGTEYIFGNTSGTLNRTYTLSGGGWTLDASISFENSSNKVTNWSGTPSDTKYPSEKLVFDSLGMKANGSKTESDIENGKFTIDGQNSTTKLTLTSVSTLTIVSNVGVPNFAITIDNSANASDVSISVKTSDELTTLYHSTAGGTSIAAGSIVQITAVGDCWTLAEFTAPTP